MDNGTDASGPEVPKADDSDEAVTLEVLLANLEDMYWKATTREVCNMILYLQELKDVEFDPKTEEDDLEELTNFRRIFSLWTSNQTKLPNNLNGLYDEIMQKAKVRYPDDTSRLYARYLLLSSNFLDLDILYEPEFSMWPSYLKGLPCVERVKGKDKNGEKFVAYRALYCSGCDRLHRTKNHHYCMYSPQCTEEKSANYPILQAHTSRTIDPIQEGLEMPLAVRTLCQSCAYKDSNHPQCNARHIVEGSHINPPGKEAKYFQARISFEEDMKSDSGVASTFLRLLYHNEFEGALGLNPADKSVRINLIAYQLMNTAKTLFSRVSKVLKYFKNSTTPGGGYHLSVMFGPLILEAGASEGAKGGILISPRQCPSLFPDSMSDLQIDGDENVAKEAFAVFTHNITKKRQLETKSIAPRKRNILGSMKCVFGGAFSGFLETSDEITQIIDELMKASDTWASYRARNQKKTDQARSRKLHRLADEVVTLLKAMYGGDIQKHLKRMAELLVDPNTNLSFNKVTNNCQNFVSKLLHGKAFEYLFPRLSSGSLEGDRTSIWQNYPDPRYLLCFKDRISRDGNSAITPTDLLTDFVRNENNEEDLIDYLQARLYRGFSPSRGLTPGWFKSKEMTNDENHPVIKLAEMLLTTPLPDKNYILRSHINRLWEHPHSAISVLQFHLLRDPNKYRDQTGRRFTDDEWLSGRVRLFRQLDAFATLAGAFGSAVAEAFTATPDLVSRVSFPRTAIYGNAFVDDCIRRIRLFPLIVWHIIYRFQKKETVVVSASTNSIIRQEGSPSTE